MVQLMVSFVFVLIGFSYAVFAGEHENAVQNTFLEYRNALLSEDGEKAWALCDIGTHKLYEQYLSSALNMKKSELNTIDTASKITILRLRHDLSKKQLQEMTGKDIFVRAINKGWISKSTVESIKSLEHVEVNGNYAIASPKNGEPPSLFFIKEEGGWRLALWKTVALAEKYVDQMISESGLSQEDYIKEFLEKISIKKFDEKILEGPLDN